MYTKTSAGQTLEPEMTPLYETKKWSLLLGFASFVLFRLVDLRLQSYIAGRG
jgi:hypothetical protein